MLARVDEKYGDFLSIKAINDGRNLRQANYPEVVKIMSGHTSVKTSKK